jgi:hypothetical protein
MVTFSKGGSMSGLSRMMGNMYGKCSPGDGSKNSKTWTGKTGRVNIKAEKTMGWGFSG